MKRRRLGRLHVVTDTVLQERYDHVMLAALAAEGGADVVQYRDKTLLDLGERVQVAQRMLAQTQRWGRRLVVNDHPDVAMIGGADGVHVGRDDALPREARALLPTGLVGATAHSLEEALRLAAEPVDYLGVGPVYGTRSKGAVLPALGLEALARIVHSVEVPVVAIGGITSGRVAEVMDAGAYGVAVLSEVVCARDPLMTTGMLREAVDSCVVQSMRVPVVQAVYR